MWVYRLILSAFVLSCFATDIFTFFKFYYIDLGYYIFSNFSWWFSSLGFIYSLANIWGDSSLSGFCFCLFEGRLCLPAISLYFSKTSEYYFFEAVSYLSRTKALYELTVFYC